MERSKGEILGDRIWDDPDFGALVAAENALHDLLDKARDARMFYASTWRPADGSDRYFEDRLPETPTKCPARLHHGPGHQSKTKCEHTLPHDVHYAHVLGQETTWRGEKAFSGAFDELPQED